MSKSTEPKVVLVGPIAPYRGGIAQYSNQLYKALQKISQVRAVSFSKQYPKWLYPSATDKEGTGELKADGVDFSLNIYSPLSWRRTAKSIARQKPDLVIICWWTLIWQPAFAYMARYLRARGIKTYFLCHNLYDHSAKKPVASFSKGLLKQADGYIVHSEDQQAEIKQLKPSAEIIYRPHPIYNQFPAAKTHLAKRGRLELLFFGFIRPYKGLDILLKALAKTKDQDVYLTVAGEAWEDPAGLKKMIQELNIPNVEMILKYVDDETAAKYFDRADVVALPYRSATGSGVVSVAYHYLKPVLASEVGGLKDVVIDGQTGWLVKPNSAEAISQALSKISRSEAKNKTAGIKEFCRQNSWEKMAEAIIKRAL